MIEVIIGLAILAFIIVTILAVFLNTILSLVEKISYRLGKRSPKEVKNADSEQIVLQMDPAVYKVISGHMKIMNDHYQSVQYVTETFIREVFFATFQVSETDKRIEEMIESLAEESKNRYRFLTFEFDEYTVYDKKNVLVGVNRTNHGGPTRVKYMLYDGENGWRIHHIVRPFKGKVVEKNDYEDGTIGYLLNIASEDDDSGYHIFLLASMDLPEVEVDHFVYMEGYLEIDNKIGGSFYYHAVTVNAIQ